MARIKALAQDWPRARSLGASRRDSIAVCSAQEPRRPYMISPGTDRNDSGVLPDPSASSRALRASIAGRRILVVDDDLDACEVLRMILEGHGARVETAHSVAAALEKIKQDPPDVLVSDIGMPGQSGYQLIEAVRKLKGDAASILAVAVTAFSRPEDRKAALRAGFNLHLAKPLNAAELITVISNVTPDC